MKIIKKCAALALVLLLVPFGITANAQSSVSITLDGQILPSDTAPIIVEDRTMVPMRVIFEALGYTVTWRESDRVITASSGSTTLTLKIDSRLMQKNAKYIAMDVAPLIENARAMVPLRAVAEATGAHVEWDDATRTVSIQSAGYGLSDPQAALDGVVMITTNKTQGSGFVLSADGLIVTNCHVLSGATVVAITFNDGSVYMDDVTVAGYDVRRDLAILHINRTNLTALPVGVPSALAEGDTVTAIGSPKGSQNTVTSGKVLAVTDNYVVADARIQHGNSGGVLLNAADQVVGVTSFSTAGTDKITRYFSQRADFLAGISRTGSYTLEELTKAISQPLPPAHISVTHEGSAVYLDWEILVNASYYLLEVSDTVDGTYTRIQNSDDAQGNWGWGYPHCFGLVLSGHGTYHKYYRVAAVYNGQASAFSEPIEITVTAP